jgi:CYTH domain-containing protein
MNYEIERKFIVADNSWKEGLTEADSSFIQQAYLSVYPDPTVRVRIKDSNAWLNIKAKPKGISRKEFEYKIPHKEAIELIKMAISGQIIKRRYEVRFEGKKWEVDEYLGDNEGLVTAELEMKKADEEFEKPSWLGEEVSLAPEYKNSALAEKPFKSW